MTRTRRLAAAYIALAAAVAVLFALNLFWGSVSLAPGAVLTALLGKGGDALAGNIILQLRLPRAVMAALLGAALSAAGYLLQTFFANPIAGPFVMGVSSGAKLAVALTMVVFLDHGMLTSSATMIAAAFAGAMAAMAFVLAVARRVQRMSILVICGVMIGYICSAITDIVVAFAQDSNIVNLHNWSQGSFSGVTWANVQAAALVVLPALAASFLLSKPMAAYQMGEAYARSVGVNVKPFSAALVLLSSLLAACVTAFAKEQGVNDCIVLDYPTLSSSCWAAQSRCMCCRGAAWAVRLSACSATCWPAVCSRPRSCPSARSRPCSAHRWSSGCWCGAIQSGRAHDERKSTLHCAGACHRLRQDTAALGYLPRGAAGADPDLDRAERRRKIHPAQNAGGPACPHGRHSAAGGEGSYCLYRYPAGAEAGPHGPAQPPDGADHLL